jgi:hypothetical protein
MRKLLAALALVVSLLAAPAAQATFNYQYIYTAAVRQGGGWCTSADRCQQVVCEWEAGKNDCYTVATGFLGQLSGHWQYYSRPLNAIVWADAHPFWANAYQLSSPDLNTIVQVYVRQQCGTTSWRYSPAVSWKFGGQVNTAYSGVQQVNSGCFPQAPTQ